MLIEDFSMSLTLFNKFNEVWAKMKITDRTLQRDCQGKIKNFAWLIFITAKGNLYLSSYMK